MMSGRLIKTRPPCSFAKIRSKKINIMHREESCLQLRARKKESEMPSSPFSSAIRNSAPTFGVWLNMRNVLCSIRALCTTFRDITRKQRSKATSKRRKNIKQRIIYVITIRRSATLLQVHVDDHLVAFFFLEKKA